MRAEPALRFWLDYVEAEGGVAEEEDDSALVVLPEHLQGQLDLPEDLSVTSDTDVAREDGALLIIPGQPVLTRAAEALLQRGDVGWAHLPWPVSPHPGRDVLQAAARDRVQVDHGRVDLDGQPAAVYLPGVHVGVLVEYLISFEDRFQEKEQLWVDGRSGRLLDGALGSALQRSFAVPGPGRDHRSLLADPALAISRAHVVLNRRASQRLGHLVAETPTARDAELSRVAAYYDAALESIAARRDAAVPERQKLYDAQAEATAAERARRLQETEEKFAARHEIRPFRLHLVGIPALVVPFVVRRGSRTYALDLDWYLPFATFGPVACPHCDGPDILVAGRERLGCRACLPRVGQAPSGLAPVDDLSPNMTANRASPEDGPAAANGRGPGAGASGRAGENVRGAEPAAALSEPGLAPSWPGRRRTGASNESRSEGRAQRGATNGPGSSARAPDRRQWAAQVRQVQTAGRHLAESFWQAVGREERWPRNSTVPHSPLEVVYRLYGVEGPLRAAGIPPGRWPSRFSAATMPAPPEDAATTGTLEVGSLSVPFTLRWRLSAGRPVVAEVLPWQALGGSGLLPSERFDSVTGPWLTESVPRPKGLGLVEEQLWAHVAEDGMPFVTRCLTVWWRLQGQRRLRGFEPDVTAAAVTVLTGRRSDCRMTVKAAADRHRVAQRALGDACRTLDVVLEAVGSTPW